MSEQSFTLQEQYKPEVLKAIKAFKAKKTFKLSQGERMSAMKALNYEIALAYDKSAPVLTFGTLDGSSSGSSYFSPVENLICLNGKLSIITLLHEIAHSLFGADENKARSWSVGLFARVYPRQFACLTFDPPTGMFTGNANFRTPNARIAA